MTWGLELFYNVHKISKTQKQHWLSVQEKKQFNKCSSLGFISYVLPSPLSLYKYGNAALASGSSIPAPAHPNHPFRGRGASCPKVENATRAPTSTSTLPLKIQCQSQRDANSLTDCWCPSSSVQNSSTDFTSRHKWVCVLFVSRTCDCVSATLLFPSMKPFLSSHCGIRIKYFSFMSLF